MGTSQTRSLGRWVNEVKQDSLDFQDLFDENNLKLSKVVK